jgi:hypothetical protein
MPDIESIWDDDDNEQFHFTEEERSPDYSKLVEKIHSEKIKERETSIIPEEKTEYTLSDLSEPLPRELTEREIKQIARVQRFRKE